MPFTPRPVQEDYWRVAEGHRRRVAVKGRQMMYSTAVYTRHALYTLSQPNETYLIVTQKGPTLALFRTAIHRIYDDLARVGLAPTLSTDNDDMMYFPLLNSRVLFEPAGGQGVSRSYTATRVHCTEVPFWPNPGLVLAGILNSAARTSEVDLESTPGPPAGPFYEMVIGLSNANPGLIARGWHLLFYPWWWEPDYTLGDLPPPIDLTPHEAWLTQAHGLTGGQILWRRSEEAELRACGSTFEAEYPESPETCFLTASGRFLSPTSLQRLRAGCVTPLATEGDLHIYRPVFPGRRYVIGADASHGLPGGDFSAFSVLDCITCEQVASYLGRPVPSEFAKVLADTGHRYNEAMVAVERQDPGRSVLAYLQDNHNYGNLYYPPNDIQPGWSTNVATRDIMMSDLRAFCEGGHLTLYDERTFLHLANLSWSRPRGVTRLVRPEAIGSAHDDAAIALAIAIEARNYAGAHALRARPTNIHDQFRRRPVAGTPHSPYAPPLIQGVDPAVYDNLPPGHHVLPNGIIVREG